MKTGVRETQHVNANSMALTVQMDSKAAIISS
jgi:hypothetical protein